MRYGSSVYKWLEKALHAIYPPLCALCGAPGVAGRDLCPSCRQELPRIQHPCLCCAAPLQTANHICGPCQQQPPLYRRSIIPFRYAAPLDHLLQELKFHQGLQLSPLLGELLGDAVIDSGIELPNLLLPVPLHSKRLRERGYNQSLELARLLSRRLGVPLDHKWVSRSRHTPAQTSLPAKERRKNLRGAFRVNGSLPKHVAIIDDVVTTGATVTELAKTLKRSGVEVIDIWAIARAGTKSI